MPAGIFGRSSFVKRGMPSRASCGAVDASTAEHCWQPHAYCTTIKTYARYLDGASLDGASLDGASLEICSGSTHHVRCPCAACDAVQDIGQGKMEPDAGHMEGATQPTGTEYGAATEERTSASGADTGRQSQQVMADAPPVSQEGGRFDEEPQPGDHPYDPRPR